MCDNVKGNPFAGLFSSVNDAVSFSSQHQANCDESSNANYVEQTSDVIKDESYNEIELKTSDVKDKIDQLIADVFGLALRSDSNNVVQRTLIFIDTDSIEHAVFERLMLPNPVAKMTYNQYSCKPPSDSHVIQVQVIPYLYESYRRLKQYHAKKDLEDVIRDTCQIVLRNVNTALQEPDLFQSQEV